MGPCLLRVPARFKVPQYLNQFFLPNLSSNVMSDRCADDLRFDRWQVLQRIFDERFADSGESVSIVEGEVRKFKTLPANLQHLWQ